MGRTILLERRQNESVGRRNSRTTFLRSDWPRPFARREVGVEMDWVDPKINDPRQGDLEFKFKRSHAKIGGRIQILNKNLNEPTCTLPEIKGGGGRTKKDRNMKHRF
ncbi:hypothetical protein TNCV_1902141 [Trichonephila clavipes]|nr:hypothetical protein TNCV_1902141 [Trichonephila clavipes]